MKRILTLVLLVVAVGVAQPAAARNVHSFGSRGFAGQRASHWSPWCWPYWGFWF